MNFRFWPADTPTHLDLSPLYPPPFPPTVQLSSCAAFEDRILVFSLFSTRLLFCPQHIFLPILPRHLPQGSQILSFSIYLQMRLGSCYLFLYSVLHFLSRLMQAANPFLRFKTKKICKGHVSKHSSIIVSEQLEQVISSAFYFIFCIWLHCWRNPLPPLCYHTLGNTLHTSCKIPNSLIISVIIYTLFKHTLTQLHHTDLKGGCGLKHRPPSPRLKLSNLEI